MPELATQEEIDAAQTADAQNPAVDGEAPTNVTAEDLTGLEADAAAIDAEMGIADEPDNPAETTPPTTVDNNTPDPTDPVDEPETEPIVATEPVVEQENEEVYEYDGPPEQIEIGTPEGTKVLKFESEEDYLTWAASAENLTKAWSATHERNRALNAEREQFQTERTDLTRQLAEAQSKLQEASSVLDPGDFDYSTMDPNSDSYDQGAFVKLQTHQAAKEAYLKQEIQSARTANSVATTPATPTNEFDTEHTKWFADIEVTDAQRAEIENTANRIATEHRDALNARNATVRAEVDVPLVYNAAYKEVMGQERVARETDPSTSVKETARVFRVAQRRAKTSPKPSTSAPPPESQTVVDPMSDDMSMEDFDKALSTLEIGGGL